MINEIRELYERQVRVWPGLARGVEGLAQARTRRVRIDWYEVFVRNIPHRIGSTTAQVDPRSVASRRCFLCAGNLPNEEEGLRFDDNFSIYCNPFPIIDHHLTIAHREHCPQRIASHFRTMLDLAAALPGYFVIYNGPECGASAPDHMHFQAGSRALFPIEEETRRQFGTAIRNYGRNVLVFKDGDRYRLIGAVNRTMDRLGETTEKEPEPLINVAVFFELGEWCVYLFPRAKHRPDVFYTEELTVSPAAIDLCGIFVVPLAADFERITGEAIAAIFQEVTLPDREFRKILTYLENER